MNTNQALCTDWVRTNGDSLLRRRFPGTGWFSTSTARKPRPGNEWAVAKFARRSPGVAAWCLVAVVVGTQLSSKELPSLWEPNPAESRQAWVLDKAKRDVRDVLDVVGHGIEIREIRAAAMDPYVLGRYRGRSQTVEIAEGIPFSKVGSLDLAAHECVHALFHQANLISYPASNWAYWVLVHETAAYVLGAHIAGRVWTSRGRDGEALTDRLVQAQRDACDISMPGSVYRQIMAAQAEFGEHAVSGDEEWSISVHFGPPELVDEIDQICRSTPDAWTAAQVISERYLQWDEEDERAWRAETDRAPLNCGAHLWPSGTAELQLGILPVE